MDEDRPELLRLLFALITERLESAHEIAMIGQRLGHTSRDYSIHATDLGQIAREIDQIAAVIVMIADSNRY